MSEGLVSRHLELNTGEIVRRYRDPGLEREHRNWHYGRSADYDPNHCQMRPMAALKPGWDDLSGAEHMGACPHCMWADEVIVIGGDNDGVWQRAGGKWERINDS